MICMSFMSISATSASSNITHVHIAHEIQTRAKETEQFSCVLPDKFVAGCIIAKLSPYWRDFANSLKHKR
jgi:hypothetical protein